MNADIKYLWLRALRGGHYTQCEGAMRNQDDHCCCLGVLADLLVQHGVGRWNKRTRNYDHLYVDGFGDASASQLQLETLKHIGLGAAQQATLIAMNDDGKPFTEIADFIEERL